MKTKRVSFKNPVAEIIYYTLPPPPVDEKKNLPDLSYAGRDFSNGKYNHTDFSNKDLSYAKFKNAQLRDSKFHNANLNYAKMNHADLGGAELQGAILVNTDLRKVRNLKYAHRLDLAWMGRADEKIEGSVLPEGFPYWPSCNNILISLGEDLSIYKKIQLLQEYLFIDSFTFKTGNDLDNAIFELTQVVFPLFEVRGYIFAEKVRLIQNHIFNFIDSVKQFRRELIDRRLTAAPIITDFTPKAVLQILNFMFNIWNINENDGSWITYHRGPEIISVFSQGEKLSGWQYKALAQAANCGWIKDEKTRKFTLSESGIINFAKYLEILSRDSDKKWRFQTVLKFNPRLKMALNFGTTDSKSLQKDLVLKSAELTTQQVLQILSYVFNHEDINYSKYGLFSGKKAMATDRVTQIFGTQTLINVKKLSYLIKAADLPWEEIKPTSGLPPKLSMKGQTALIDWLTKEGELDSGVKQRVDGLIKANPWLKHPSTSTVSPSQLGL